MINHIGYELEINKENMDFMVRVFYRDECVGEYVKEGDHTYINGDYELVNDLMKLLLEKIGG